jgi:hypothetical protein
MDFSLGEPQRRIARAGAAHQTSTERRTMKRQPIIGYIVCTSMGSMYAGAKSAGAPQTLWLGYEATLFSSRKVARTHIARTLRYAAVNNLKWSWVENARILAVRRLG